MNNLLKLQIAKLFQAVYQEDYATVKRLYEIGPSNLLDSNDPLSGKTPLIISILINSQKMLFYLLELGVDPNKADFENKNPLMYACEIGNKDIVEILCLYKSNVNSYDVSLNSCLKYCCNFAETTFNLECVEVLLKNNIDVNLDLKGSTTFLELCKSSNLFESLCVKLLIEAKANVNLTQSSDGHSALHFASKNGSIKLCYFLLKNGCNPNQLNNLGQSAISFATLYGHLDILRLFWSFNVNLNYIDKLGHSLFYYAIKRLTPKNKKTSYSIVKYLSSRGCFNLDETDLENQTPKIQRKLKRLNRVNFRKFNLNISKSSTSREFTLWMLKIKDFFQALSKTLHFREHFKKKQIDYDEFETFFKTYYIETLPNGISKSLFDSLKIAQTKEFVCSKKIFDIKIYTKLASPLYSFGKPVGLKRKPTLKFVKKNLNKTQKFKMYIPCKKNEIINFQVKELKCYDLMRFKEIDSLQFRNDARWYMDDLVNETHIDFANVINSGDLVTLEEILSKKSDTGQDQLLNSTDKFYKTPLMIAIINDKYDMIDFLLSKNVNINLRDNFNWTALHHAVRIGNFKAIEILVERNPKLKLIKTIGGNTPKLLADRLGMKDVSLF
jgi:ankyrin repeat protein